MAADEKTTQVRTVFSWSYQSLAPAPARAFRLLSLHPGPDISTPAAAALLDAPVPATRQLLRTLAGGHLLEETARDRFQFHDLVRLYAVECAHTNEPESSRKAAIHRLLTWYMHTADAFQRVMGPARPHVHLEPPSPSCRPAVFTTTRQGLAWAESETANLRPVIRQATAVDDDVIAWKLPATLGTILSYQQKYADLLPALISALDATQRLGDRAAEAQILTDLASAYLYLGRPARRQILSACPGHPNRNQQPAWSMGSTAARGVAHLDLEQFSEARDYLQQALATARQTPDPLAEGMTLIWLGAVLENLGTPETAIKLPETAAALLGETGNRWQHCIAVQRIAGGLPPPGPDRRGARSLPKGTGHVPRIRRPANRSHRPGRARTGPDGPRRSRCSPPMLADGTERLRKPRKRTRRAGPQSAPPAQRP